MFPLRNKNIHLWLCYWPSVKAPSVLRGLGGVVVEVSPPTSEAACSNLRAGASSWKVGSYLPMPGGFINNILLKQLGKIPKQIILSLLAGRTIYKRKREKIKIYKLINVQYNSNSN